MDNLAIWSQAAWEHGMSYGHFKAAVESGRFPNPVEEYQKKGSQKQKRKRVDKRTGRYEHVCPCCQTVFHGRRDSIYCSDRCSKRMSEKRKREREAVTRNNRDPSPCADCSQKKPGCHGGCTEYHAWLSGLEKIKDARKEYLAKPPVKIT